MPAAHVLIRCATNTMCSAGHVLVRCATNTMCSAGHVLVRCAANTMCSAAHVLVRCAANTMCSAGHVLIRCATNTMCSAGHVLIRCADNTMCSAVHSPEVSLSTSSINVPSSYHKIFTPAPTLLLLLYSPYYFISLVSPLTLKLKNLNLISQSCSFRTNKQTNNYIHTRIIHIHHSPFTLQDFFSIFGFFEFPKQTNRFSISAHISHLPFHTPLPTNL